MHFKSTPTKFWQIYKRLLIYGKPVWWSLVISIIGYLLYAGASTAMVEIMKRLVNLINDQKYDLIYQIALAMIVIAIVSCIGTFLGKYYIALGSRFIIHKLRCDIFNKLLSLPKKTYDANRSGNFIAQLTFDIELVTDACADAITVSLREGLYVIGLVSYLFYTNWLLTLIFIGSAPIIIVLAMYTGRRFRKLTHRIQKSIGNVSHIATEAINGFSVVRIFAGQNYEKQRFYQVSSENYRQNLKVVATEAISVPFNQLLVAIFLALLVWLSLGALRVENLDAGSFIAFIMAAGLITKPLRQLGNVHAKIQKGIAAAQKLFEQLDQDNEVDTGKLILKNVQGDIKYTDANFSYVNKQVLHNINFHVQAGQTIAVIGKSGSGKTTLVNLLARFYNLDSGKILIDDKDIDNYTLNSWRSNIAIVEQKVTLFYDTIANNIAYGSLHNTSAKKIEEAAKQAYALEFIQDLPQGFNTLIGDNGLLLSGGQRQRLALARAFLKDAPIIILDEATSALDTQSEQYIQKALNNVINGKTTFIIAHRLSTIRQADMIVVIDKGCIVETGTHTRLIATENSVYSKLYAEGIL